MTIYRVKATAPTVYQSQSLKHFGLQVKAHASGSYSVSTDYDTEEEAQAYLIDRAERYYCFEEEKLSKAIERIKQYGSLELDAAIAHIEEINEEENN
jgi:hypothetical protein